ncbi:hypothetical protein [Mycobacterium sp.]|uniref:hypothetical protein n=1 Tax=Mycobacterium sp. TaxID=1785 RepID=UPI003C7557AB
MTHAVDVADPTIGKTEKAKLGQIWQFFASEEKAKARGRPSAMQRVTTRSSPRRR